MTLSTESANRDIRLVAAGMGRVVVVGGVVEGENNTVAILSSDSQAMTLKSGAELYLQPGSGYPVTIGDGNGHRFDAQKKGNIISLSPSHLMRFVK